MIVPTYYRSVKCYPVSIGANKVHKQRERKQGGSRADTIHTHTHLHARTHTHTHTHTHTLELLKLQKIDVRIFHLKKHIYSNIFEYLFAHEARQEQDKLIRDITTCIGNLFKFKHI